jgi:hypothetical protein
MDTFDSPPPGVKTRRRDLAEQAISSKRSERGAPFSLVAAYTAVIIDRIVWWATGRSKNSAETSKIQL